MEAKRAKLGAWQCGVRSEECGVRSAAVKTYFMVGWMANTEIPCKASYRGIASIKYTYFYRLLNLPFRVIFQCNAEYYVLPQNKQVSSHSSRITILFIRRD